MNEAPMGTRACPVHGLDVGTLVDIWRCAHVVTLGTEAQGVWYCDRPLYVTGAKP